MLASVAENDDARRRRSPARLDRGGLAALRRSVNTAGVEPPPRQSIDRHVLGQNGQDALGRGVFLNRSVRVAYSDHRVGALLFDVNAVRGRFRRVLATEQSAEEVLLLDLLARVGIEVADVEVALRAVAIFDRE